MTTEEIIVIILCGLVGGLCLAIYYMKYILNLENAVIGIIIALCATLIMVTALCYSEHIRCHGL